MQCEEPIPRYEARLSLLGNLWFDPEHSKNYYCADIEIDYKSDDLTYETILNILRGRYSTYVISELTA